MNRDIADAEPVLAAVRVIRAQVELLLIPIFTSDRTVRARCTGVGVLTLAQAESWGATGPRARASSLTQDLRRAEPYAAYERLICEVPVQTSGDVLAGIVVRALETVERCRIVEQALEGMLTCRSFKPRSTPAIRAPTAELLIY